MLNQIFVSDAFAQTSEVAAAATSPEFSFTSFVPLILIFAVFYFLIIRPQSKKYKDHQLMVDSLKVGNKVITSGGIIGVIKEVDTKENLFEVEIAQDVTVKVIKSHVADIVKKEEKKTKK
ncbi:MAG: preprotein translocase subunit YajC [Proteobacteria bacterium]|nr:preprotein translocase subunit YajC [Pseudomonadota bacterium]